MYTTCTCTLSGAHEKTLWFFHGLLTLFVHVFTKDTQSVHVRVFDTF